MEEKNKDKLKEREHMVTLRRNVAALRKVSENLNTVLQKDMEQMEETQGCAEYSIGVVDRITLKLQRGAGGAMSSLVLYLVVSVFAFLLFVFLLLR